MPQVLVGAVANDGMGDPDRVAYQKINKWVQLNDGIVNAASYLGLTKEAQIQAAISDPAATAVFVPASLWPYNSILVAFNPAKPMYREGGISHSSVLDATAYGGLDLVASITAAMPSLLPGMTLDCRGFIGTPAFSASLTYNVPYTKVLWPTSAAMGPYSVTVPSGTHGVEFKFPKPWSGGSYQSGNVFTPTWTYSGSTYAFKIGDASNYTEGFVGENFGINMAAATGGCYALWLARCIDYQLIRPAATVPVSQVNTMIGLFLDGTGGFTGWGTIISPMIVNFSLNINMYLANANTIIGGQNRGLVAAGCNGVKMVNCNGNHIFGIDSDGFVTGYEIGNLSYYNQIFIRSEGNCTTDVLFDAGSRHNIVQSMSPLVVVDTSSNFDNNVVEPGNGVNFGIDFGFKRVAVRGDVSFGVQTPTAVPYPGTGLTPVDLSKGNYVLVNVPSNIAVVIGAPTNPPGGATSGSTLLIVAIENTSGGALTTAPSFTTGSPGYRLNAAVVNPPNGDRVLYIFVYDIASGLCHEIGNHATAMSNS